MNLRSKQEGQKLVHAMICLGLCFILLSTFWQQGSGYAQDETQVVPSPFGIYEGYWRPQAAADLNLSWERISLDWRQIQPNGPGEFEIAAVLRDEWLQSAQIAERDIVLTISGTPTWASQSGESWAVPDGLYAPIDNPENLWAVFLEQLVPYMAERDVHHWVIWDAPDIPPDEATDPAQPARFAGTVNDYYRLVKVAYQVIHQNDPNAVVLAGGFSWWPDIAAQRESYLHRFVRLVQEDDSSGLSNDYFDGVFLSIWLTGQPVGGVVQTSDAIGDIVTEAQNILNTNELLNKPIWIEFALSPTADNNGGLAGQPLPYSPEQQADLVVQGCTSALAAGADRIGIYKLYDSNFTPGMTIPFGLIRHDNTLRPAYEAYRMVTHQFIPYQEIEPDRTQNSRLVVMQQTERTVYVMWSFGTNKVDFWIPSAFGDEVLLYNAKGMVLPEPRQGIGINAIPVYVIEARPAQPAPDGIIRISGTPVIFILDGPPRSVWATIGGNAVQLR